MVIPHLCNFGAEITSCVGHSHVIINWCILLFRKEIMLRMLCWWWYAIFLLTESFVLKDIRLTCLIFSKPFQFQTRDKRKATSVPILKPNIIYLVSASPTFSLLCTGGKYCWCLVDAHLVHRGETATKMIIMRHNLLAAFQQYYIGQDYCKDTPSCPCTEPSSRMFTPFSCLIVSEKALVM